jgi:RNA polymerase sigma-70 factor (ECF subfamily)
MTDEELVRRYLADRGTGDFRELVERQAPRVLRLVASVLGPYRQGDIEETVQDVFVRVHEKLDRFHGEAAFSTWLYRIAYNLAIDRAKLARLRMPHIDVDALHALASASDPQREAIDAERAALLAEAVEALPDLYRSVVYLHYWQETPVDEIAAYLGAPANTIKSYLFRARERIGRFLEQKGLTS